MSKLRLFADPGTIRCILIIVVFVLLTGSLSHMTFFNAMSVNLGDPQNSITVTPSDHCEGGECCIMSECSCPNCAGRGEPGGTCDNCGEDLCDNCGNCPECGISPCPVCRDTCFACGSINLCDICNGCLDCGHNRDPDCPGCGEILYIQANIHDGPIMQASPVLMLTESGFEILLFAPFGMSAWAIMNILLTFAGIVLTFITIIRAVRQKKTENNGVERYVALFNIDSYIDTQTLVILNNGEQNNKRRRLGAFIAMYTLSIGAVMLLILVQDFTGAIALFDWWTIVHTALFAGILVFYRLIYIKNENVNDSLNVSSLPWEVSL